MPGKDGMHRWIKGERLKFVRIAKFTQMSEYILMALLVVSEFLIENGTIPKTVPGKMKIGLGNADFQ